MRFRSKTVFGANRCNCAGGKNRKRGGASLRKVTVLAEARRSKDDEAKATREGDVGTMSALGQFFDVVFSLKPKRCAACLGTGYVVCDLCQGRGKTGGLLTKAKGVECEACLGEGCLD
jgi:hypothetical protein